MTRYPGGNHEVMSIIIHAEEFGYYFNREKYDLIYNQTTTAFQQLVSQKQFKELATAFNQGVTNYQLESKTTLANLTHYVWLDNRKEKAISASFDETGMIHSLYLKPYVTYPKSDKIYTKNTYIMPAKGEWFVFWGGTNEFVNYHYAYESQRYAYDLIQIQNGLSYMDTPTQNENFYAFNQEIVAPAAGKVVKVVDGLKDNVPGEMDVHNPAGNYVIIQHQSKEYSMLAHLKQSSIIVREGDKVKLGQYIGLCGNSGNSSEPHLHFQIMNSADFTTGKSIRIRFQNQQEPIQGDFISNPDQFKEPLTEKIDKVDTALTIGEILLFIPRTIIQYIKNT